MVCVCVCVCVCLNLIDPSITTPQGADVFGQCRVHSGQKVEFFCSQCHVPVCVHCKMVGNHSSGEATKHKLVSVTEAFDTVMKESQRVSVPLCVMNM